MPNCAVCGESVTSGVVLHSECYEKLQEENEQLKVKLKPTKPLCIYEDEPICPFCSEILDLTDDNPVCRYCGQVIDWVEW